MIRSLALAAALLAAPPASAGIIYQFAQEGPSTGWAGPGDPGPGRVSILGRIALEDGAASGFSLDYYSGAGGMPVRDIPWLSEISFTILLDGETFRSFDLARLDGASSIDRFGFKLSGDGAGLTGEASINDSETDFFLTFGGLGFSGSMGSDMGQTGCFWARCEVSGGTSMSTVTTVPEPASAALFGLGLLGLAAVRRRA